VVQRLDIGDRITKVTLLATRPAPRAQALRKR
jgi:hypothetical protein